MRGNVCFIFLGVMALMLVTGCARKKKLAPVPPPPKPPLVEVALATHQESSSLGEVIAKLEGSTVTNVVAKEGGYLIKQNFAAGANVEKGAVLFEFDTRSFPANASPGHAGTTKIVAPVSGVASSAGPGLGDLVQPGATLMTLAAVDPIRAVFGVPSGYMAQLQNQTAGTATVTRAPDKFELVLADGTTYPEEGELDLRDVTQSDISAKTRTAAALFANPEHKLVPGEYVKIRGVSQKIPNVALVPQEAVCEVDGTDSVFVVKPDKTLELRTVKTGGQVGALRMITEGLQPGERVVVGDLEKYQDGERISPRPYVAPGS